MSYQKTILIAGGAGFLGSHLCDQYINDNWQVVCVDNLSTGHKSNISHLLAEPNFTFFKHDICKPLPSKYFDTKNYKYNVIANLASPASPIQYQRLALETLNAGSTGTLNLLDLALAHKARFFHASTSEVYGDPDVHPQPETYRGNVNSYGPRSMYDEAKRYSEALIYSYREKYKIDSGIARFFNTYGPRMDSNDGRVISNFIIQAINNQPITIYGDGNQTRSFCYVSDLIKGVVAMIDTNQEGPINLGNPHEFTILELATMIKQITGSKSKVIHKPLPIDDPMQRQPVIDLAIEKLKWEPRITLRAGLIKTINYFQTL